jgi:hypothetical protein
LAPPRETDRVVPFSELTPPDGFAVYVFEIEHDACQLLLTWDTPYDGGAPIRSLSLAAYSGGDYFEIPSCSDLHEDSK